jgi:hypothetical protein
MAPHQATAERRHMIDFTILTNKTITGIDVSVREEYLRLHIQDGEDIILVASGDCCSETWFAEILSLDALFGEKILSGEELNPLHKEDDYSRQQFDAFYGFALHTTKGTCTIIFRNSSNGYYGGDIYTLDNIRDRQPHLEHLAKQTWQPITDNEWTAYQKASH